ncbi:hypothetical protein [Polyangium jinanense]|uniref:Uncharacterized protein n=1 Tax=Polyangium jinanense TaxID=2829994 RepID=A0A9X4ASE3_9BACT|nr:hypothetical protein [Polyangium jinanense]MDC3982416.1 hypothetical protein [Polyangium jinanense]
MKPKRGTTKRITTKRRTETFSTKAALLEKLIPACAEEYEKLFGHPWSQHPLRWHEPELARSQIETDAWRVMNALGKAASAALDFFDSHGLDAGRRDHGIYYAHELHKLLKRHRRLLEGLKEKVGEFPRPIDKRQALVKSVNVRGPNVFAGLPYGRKLNDRELAIISLLMHKGEDFSFNRGMTIGDAIDRERRRMGLANKRASKPTKRWMREVHED